LIILILFLSAAGWLCVSYVFEVGYKTLKPDYHGSLPKHQFCWVFWSLLGVLSFASTGAAGLVQMAIIFCIAAGHITLACVKEEVISPMEVAKNIPPALREVYARFRRI
jgi:hypothetical protein